MFFSSRVPGRSTQQLQAHIFISSIPSKIRHIPVSLESPWVLLALTDYLWASRTAVIGWLWALCPPPGLSTSTAKLSVRRGMVPRRKVRLLSPEAWMDSGEKSGRSRTERLEYQDWIKTHDLPLVGPISHGSDAFWGCPFEPLHTILGPVFPETKSNNLSTLLTSFFLEAGKEWPGAVYLRLGCLPNPGIICYLLTSLPVVTHGISLPRQPYPEHRAER